MRLKRPFSCVLFPLLCLFTPPAAADVEHVVLCWLNKPGDTEAARALIRVSKELRDIPGVQNLVAGPPLASERPVVDDSFDVGVVMRFADAAALEEYLNHPEHVRRVNETLRPLCGRIQIYDIQH
ncbi:MAG: Dabb family protein [Gammaproteobacteria bacterium]|nr:Dabb family protein [Gammaproteobacteria bacterium]